MVGACFVMYPAFLEHFCTEICTDFFFFLQLTTPFLFKLIPGLVHLGVLLRWFPLDGAVEVNDLKSVPIEI